MNLRQEWTRAVFEEFYYAANNQKIANKKKADYQEGLEKNHADSAARSCDSYMKDPEKSRAQSRASYMKDLEKSRAYSAQHEVAKVTRKTRRKSLKWNWLDYVLQK